MFFGSPGNGDRCNHRQNLDSPRLEVGDYIGALHGSQGHYGRLFGHHHFELLLELVGDHDHVDAEGPVGQFPRLPDLIPEQLRGHGAGADDAQAAPVGDGGYQAGVAHPGHAALDDWVVYLQNLADAILHLILLNPFYFARICQARTP